MIPSRARAYHVYHDGATLRRGPRRGRASRGPPRSAPPLLSSLHPAARTVTDRPLFAHPTHDITRASRACLDRFVCGGGGGGQRTTRGLFLVGLGCSYARLAVLAAAAADARSDTLQIKRPQHRPRLSDRTTVSTLAREYYAQSSPQLGSAASREAGALSHCTLPPPALPALLEVHDSGRRL